MSKIPVALQLYTVRDSFDTDIVQTLRKVAQIGYRNVELAGFGGQSAKDLKQMLTDFGLQPIAAHVGFDVLRSDGVARVLDDYLELGCPNLIIPYLGSEWRSGAQGVAHTAEVFNEVGSRLHTEGFRLGYHNHDFEFTEKFEGKSVFELLIEGTDPGLVQFELDTYWALFAGEDPVETIHRYAGQLSWLHIKDMDRDDRSFAPIGTGSLPLDEIITAAIAAKVNYLIVEQDHATKQTQLEAVEISFKNLRDKGYA